MSLMHIASGVGNSFSAVRIISKCFMFKRGIFRFVISRGFHGFGSNRLMGSFSLRATVASLGSLTALLTRHHPRFGTRQRRLLHR